MFKEQKGITLVALVITIIVLLILAGVSISLVVNDDGVFSNAQKAVTENEEATARQEIQLSMADAQMAYAQAWAGNQSAKKVDYYKDVEFYKKNCVSARSIKVEASSEDDATAVVTVTYNSTTNQTYKTTFNVKNPSTSFAELNSEPTTDAHTNGASSIR